MTPDQLRELAEEGRTWLLDNDRGIFSIACGRCNAPFEYESQAVAAPAEWYGLLKDSADLAETRDVLADVLDALQSAYELADHLDTCARRLFGGKCTCPLAKLLRDVSDVRVRVRELPGLSAVTLAADQDSAQ
jgi:hypothetical protein